MATIDEENAKTLRKAMDVLVGTDLGSLDFTVSDVTNAYYYTTVLTLKWMPQMPHWMDLSNGGFENDGNAVPLQPIVGGMIPGYAAVISDIGETLSFTVTPTDSSTEEPITIIGFRNGVLTKWTFEGTGARVCTFTGEEDNRLILLRAVVGQAYWFDNENLMSANLQLRSVGTELDNPTLQISEIEFAGYVENDLSEAIASLGKDYPIYYTAGYLGDMSDMRKFYVEELSYEDHVLTVRGQDATKFLDKDYVGRFVGDPSDDYGGGIKKFVDALDYMIELDIDDLPYDNIYTSGEYLWGSCIFLPNKSKRDIIGQAVNLFRISEWDGVEDTYSVYINYVDAGRPKLWTGRTIANVKTLTNIGKPKKIVEPRVNRIVMTIDEPYREASGTVEEVKIRRQAIKTTPKPYYSFTASSGTITRIGPYKYKIVGAGTITISGREITFDGEEFDIQESYKGVKLKLEPFHGLYTPFATGPDQSDWGAGTVDELIDNLLKRSNVLYEFTWRGDPRLQPRDYIKADVDGSGTLIDMTIDTIELNHENGGLTSTILARKGLI